DVELTANTPQRVSVNVPMLTTGRTQWTAEIVSAATTPTAEGQPAPDYFSVNNAVSTTVEVTGRPRVLVLHENTRELSALANAMETQDLAVEVRPAAGAPRTMQELLAFDAVVLSDIPATDLSPPQLDLLKRFVADFGGGLAMFGGENSFGLGGYYRTAVEEVLPLSSRFEQEKEQPSMAMVLVIDKSGSMDGIPIALARQAAKAAVDLLSPRDQIGVVGFDGQAFIALPMSSAADRDGAKSAIDRIGAGGGTFMFAGMDAARQMLENTPARIKHMIVLGDGMTGAANHDGLTRDLADAGVTVSTVALGSGADQALMARIAEIGRGRYYLTMDPASVPQIFTRETMQASRSAIKEDLFAAVRVGDHPLLAGHENTELPFTLGYVMTRARPTAQVLLTTDTGDPLLAINPYGLGQGLAFTGDLTPRWGGEWLAWPGFGKFWSQALRALVRRPNQSSASIETTATADALHLQITEPATDGSATAPTSWRGEALDDTGRGTPVTIRPVGVGRYEARVPLGKSDRVTVRLYEPAGNQLRTVQHDRPYPAEYLLASTPDAALLTTPVFQADALRQNVPTVFTPVALTPWLLLLSILSFIAGILLRRL
ncbi:MAG: glutamine amidotransferase, partial [Planctomycetota bacterium]